MPVMAEASGAHRFIATTTESIDDTPGERIMIELTATEIAFPSSCNTVRASYVLVDDVLDPAGHAGPVDHRRCAAADGGHDDHVAADHVAADHVAAAV